MCDSDTNLLAVFRLGKFAHVTLPGIYPQPGDAVVHQVPWLPGSTFSGQKGLWPLKVVIPNQCSPGRNAVPTTASQPVIPPHYEVQLHNCGLIYQVLGTQQQEEEELLPSQDQQDTLPTVFFPVRQRQQVIEV